MGKTMDDDGFMREAIRDAMASGHRFGAVVVRDGRVIGRAGRRPKNDARYHAETEAILQAGRDLEGCTLYSTCEPCIMCFYMAWATGIKRIFYGARIRDSIGQGIPEIDISAEELNGRSGGGIELHGGFLIDECLELLEGKKRMGGKF